MERARETAPSLFSFKSHPQMPIEKQMEKLSPQVRVFALVAALAAVGGLLFVFMAGRGAAAEPELAAPPAAAVVAKKPTAPAVHKAAAPKAKAQAAKVPAAKVRRRKSRLRKSRLRSSRRRRPRRRPRQLPRKSFPRFRRPASPSRSTERLPGTRSSSSPSSFRAHMSTSSQPARRRQERSSAVPAISR